MFHIVDDESDIREFLAEVLKELGYESRTFASPLEYLEYAASDRYQLPCALLTDVQMPGMNGYEMLNKVRGYHPEIRTAVLSGFPKYEGEATFRSCAFLAKPIVVRDMAQLLDSFDKCHRYGSNLELKGFANGADKRECDLNGWRCPHGRRCCSR